MSQLLNNSMGEQITHTCDRLDCYEVIPDYHWEKNEIKFDWGGRWGFPGAIHLCNKHKEEFDKNYLPAKK